MTHYFTLEEANATLEVIKPIMDEVQAIRREILDNQPAAWPIIEKAAGNGGGQAASLLDTLRSLEHGPWWPPLDELIDTARRFYAGGLTETQPAPA